MLTFEHQSSNPVNQVVQAFFVEHGLLGQPSQRFALSAPLKVASLLLLLQFRLIFLLLDFGFQLLLHPLPIFRSDVNR